MLCWQKRGWPVVTTPTQRGFGSTFLCDMTTLSLNDDVDLSFAPIAPRASGVAASQGFRLPL